MYLVKVKASIIKEDHGNFIVRGDEKRKQKTVKSEKEAERWLMELRETYLVPGDEVVLIHKKTGVTYHRDIHGKYRKASNTSSISSNYTIAAAKTDLLRLLHAYGFGYFDEEAIKYAKINGYLELVKKAYGDSYSNTVVNVFGKDYKALEKACKKLGIKMTKNDEVYYD